jgi:predicted nucleotidyltransferase
MSKMILNTDYAVIEFFLGDYNKRAYGREISRTCRMSQKSVANSLLRLEADGILRSEEKGRTKLYFLNAKNPFIKDILLSAEIKKKILFLQKHPKLQEIFRENSGITGIFGSYARGKERADSDIDIFAIGADYSSIAKNASVFGIKASVRKFSEKEWATLIKQKNTLASEIISAHIIISGAEKFVNLAWADFYGFD